MFIGTPRCAPQNTSSDRGQGDPAQGGAHSLNETQYKTQTQTGASWRGTAGEGSPGLGIQRSRGKGETGEQPRVPDGLPESSGIQEALQEREESRGRRCQAGEGWTQSPMAMGMNED